MQYWKAHYKDALHDTDIQIVNTEEDYRTDPLSFTLDNIRFHGTSLGDFQLADEGQYQEAAEKFCLLKYGGHCSKYHITSPYIYDLQRYELETEIPISVVRKKDNCLIMGVLFIAMRYQEYNGTRSSYGRICDDVLVYHDALEVSEFSLCVDGICYKHIGKTMYFEGALGDICTQMKNDYYIKCCFTCQYSDYSPYGNDDYGCMLCYCRHKSDCLKVNSKEEYFRFLEGKDFDARQETYLCEQYCLRNQASGYRGYVDI